MPIPSPPFDATPLLRGYARLRLARLRHLDAAAAQQGVLRRLLARAANTRFGRAHGFAAITGVEGFQAQVPLRRHEEFWASWWRTPWPMLTDVTWPGLVPFFALSPAPLSGRPRRLPVTRALLRAQRGAVLDALCWHLHHHPRSRILGGFGFALPRATAAPLEELADGVQEGEPAALASELPRGLDRWLWPPPSQAMQGLAMQGEPAGNGARDRTRDWARDWAGNGAGNGAGSWAGDWIGRLELLTRSLPAEALRVLAGPPGWLHPMLAALAAQRGGTPPLPALELLLHGGRDGGRDGGRTGAAARLRPLLPAACDVREIHATAEGVLAVGDRGPGEGLRLVADRGAFLEFVPLAELDRPFPTRHWAATIETGVEYAVVLSSCAGLWAYVTGETVRFLERSPPRLVVTGMVGGRLSAFGERLQAREIDAALASASRGLGLEVAEYSVGPLVAGAAGMHLWLVEAAAEGAGQELDALAPRLAGALDAALSAASADYAAQRRGGVLDAPQVELLPPGSFAGWLRAEGRPADPLGIPHVVADPQRFAQMAAALLP